jgi:DNA-binding response OmpR family regulator/HPt (histidine-containing phosphotransfer) domain-containing protein
MPMTGSKADTLREALADARARFIAAFPERCDQALACLEGAPGGNPPDPASLQALAHKMAGLAGMAGFPTVSSRALALEDLACSPKLDRAGKERGRILIDQVRQAFVKDLSDASRHRDDPAVTSRARAGVLIAEDDDDQRAVIAGYLADAGYEPIPVSSGDDVLAAARASRPAAIVLDVRLPGVDGYSVCQSLKADPELAAIPVVFLSARLRVDERLAGLALGADDYLTKPADMRELAVRVARACARSRESSAASPAGPLTYAEFFDRGRAMLARSPASVVFLRTPADQRDVVTALVGREVRTRDLVGVYDSSHLVLLLPELSAPVACDRMTGIIARLNERGVSDATAGVAVSASGGASLMDLMREAHEALVEARYLGKPAVVGGGQGPTSDGPEPSGFNLLLADDDPDVARIVDAQMRAAGHECTLAFDGEQALAAMERRRPDVLMLDLMMPKLGGFEVLNRLNAQEGPRPAVIVLSARGRETDVMRAFDLGASDYVTKPFSPQELLARVSRLVR